MFDEDFVLHNKSEVIVTPRETEQHKELRTTQHMKMCGTFAISDDLPPANYIAM